MALWHVVVGLMTFWIIVLLLMGSSLHQSSDVTEQVERELFEAMSKLDELRKENKQLKRVAADLKRFKPTTAENGAQENRAVEKSLSDSEFDDADMSLSLPGNGVPGQTHEILRRRIQNDVAEHWYFMRSQLNQLKEELVNTNTLPVDKLKKVMEINTDYMRTINRDITNFTNLTANWRKSEADSLAALVQNRIDYVQNPKDCSTARKLLCNINKGCGFGCQLHHLTYCFLVAYGTNRTLIILSHGWRYSPNGGFEKYFMPASKTCLDRSGSQKMWDDNVDQVQVVELPIVDNLRPRPPYMPQAIPADLASRLVRLHGHPFVWWVGQFVKYLFRPQPWLQEDMELMKKKLGFTNPIVGIHVRRTDKVGSEAAFHAVDEYMVHVDEYYNQLEMSQKVEKRRVYVASDDPDVLNEIRERYPVYDVIGDAALSKTAGLSSRYTDDALRAVVLDIHFLSISDHLVCTFSSQVCRLAYELMQTMHSDASRYFRSLDDIYYFGGQTGHHQVVLVEHKAQPESEELDLVPGDMIGVAGNHWNGFSKGRNERTGRIGVYPSYKVREHLQIVDFPTYPEADKLDDDRIARRLNGADNQQNN